MKKILIRAGYTPLESLSTEQILCKNLIGDNVGNLVYAYGLFRTLMTSEDTEFVANRYQTSTNKAEWVNENCSMFILPFADMFRATGIKHMNETAALVKKLTIPCVIVGIGLSEPLGSDVSLHFPFDEASKNLLNAVLDKSALVGVRGEQTGRYLEHLGYVEGRHFQVIGCPSMYGIQGGELQLKPLNLTDDSLVSLNASIYSTPNALNFLKRVSADYPNSVFLPQRIQELWTLYAGLPYQHDRDIPMYPTRISDDIYQQDRVKYFLHAKPWIDYLKTVDISVGSRLHGNIAALQAGTPCVLIPHDTRMKELADYHKLPHVMASDVQEGWTLRDLVEHADFSSMHTCHKENFQRYLSFLEKKRHRPHLQKHGRGRRRPARQEAVADGAARMRSICRHAFNRGAALRWQGIRDFQVNELKEKNRQLKQGSSLRRDHPLLYKAARKVLGRK